MSQVLLRILNNNNIITLTLTLHSHRSIFKNIDLSQVCNVYNVNVIMSLLLAHFRTNSGKDVFVDLSEWIGN